MHLGMSGSFRVLSGGRARRLFHERAKPPRTITSCSTCERRAVTFNDPRRFGCMELVARDDRRGAALSALGPEPLGNAFDAACWPRLPGQEPAQGRALTSASSRGSATSMSARRCTGRSFRRSAAPRPSRRGPARQDRAARLVGASSVVLNDAIGAGGSSLRDHRQTDGRSAFPAQFPRLRPRGRGCPTPGCKGTIKRIVQTGRSTFYCPVCQK